MAKKTTVEMTDAQLKVWEELKAGIEKKAEAETLKKQLETDFPKLETILKDIQAVDPKYRAPWQKKSPQLLATAIKEFIGKQPGKAANKAAIVSGVKSDAFTETKIGATLTKRAAGKRNLWNQAGDVYTLK